MKKQIKIKIIVIHKIEKVFYTIFYFFFVFIIAIIKNISYVKQIINNFNKEFILQIFIKMYFFYF